MVRAAREPVLAQLRLAWWRERLAEDPARWPAGEPLLMLLADVPAARLGVLADGWEAVLLAGDLEPWLAARAAGVEVIHADPAAARLARGWAIGELAAQSPPDTAMALAAAHDWRRARLARDLRPLLLLHHFAARAAQGQRGGLLGAVRLGLFGR